MHDGCAVIVQARLLIELHQIIEHLLACGDARALSCMRPLKRTLRWVPVRV